MNRTLKLSIMLALATGSGHVLAQNLGPAQVRSTMDQPLVAEIPLTGVSGNTDDIHVALASEEAFSRAGLNREGLPVALSFAVAKNAAGQPVVRVTSSAPVRDTYLDFLVEVGSANNKVIREVTMLLDPPGSTPSAPTASAAPGPRPSRTSDVPARVPSAAEPTPSRAEAAPRPVAEPRPQVAAAPKQHAAAPKAAAAASGQVGPVQRGQTLSSIARENAGGGDLNQVMVALLKANPDAFYRDNINALKTGAVLRIPSPDDIKAQSVAAALTEVRRQNADWRAGTARAPAVVADGAATGAAQGGKNKPAAANDRLALVPSKDGGEAASSRAGTKGGTGDAQVAGLKQDLASSQEAVASLRQQGEELKSRVTDLEAIQSKNERLISLKDAEIAELQRKLGESNKAGAAGDGGGTCAARFYSGSCSRRRIHGQDSPGRCGRDAGHAGLGQGTRHAVAGTCRRSAGCHETCCYRQASGHAGAGGRRSLVSPALGVGWWWRCGVVASAGSRIRPSQEGGTCARGQRIRGRFACRPLP